MQFNKHLQEINIYEAGKPIELLVRSFGIAPENIIKMASNENPFGLSPKVAKVIAENSHKSYLYPDDSMYQLKDELAKKFKVIDKNIILVLVVIKLLSFVSMLNVIIIPRFLWQKQHLQCMRFMENRLVQLF